VSAIAFFAASFALLLWYGRPMSFEAAAFFLVFVGELTLIWVGFLVARDLLLLWRAGAPAGPTRLIFANMLERFFREDRPGNVFHSLMTLAPMMIAFTVVKDNIGAIHPFNWDQTFVHWDYLLGGGTAPWKLLQPILGHPPITVALNFIYDLWFPLMFAGLLWQAFSPRSSVLRMQFMLSFGFAWFFAGSVLALIFSSAGPCFHDKLFPNHPLFADQMAYLNSIGPKWIWSLAVQNDLWNSYVTGSGEISGISAMPSMHVAVATLFALLGWRKGVSLGIALSIFAALILLGSVHLAWHYAVDGLAGAVLAVCCWLAGGYVARNWCSLSDETRSVESR
jgi:hypothetical protein